MKYIEGQQDQPCVEVHSDLGINDCIGVSSGSEVLRAVNCALEQDTFS